MEISLIFPEKDRLTWLQKRKKMRKLRRPVEEWCVTKTLELSQNGVAILDHQGMIQWTNRMMQILLGTDSIDLLWGESISGFIPEKIADEFLSLIELSKMTGRSLGPIETELRMKGERSLYTRIMLSPVTVQGKQLILMDIQDISAWKYISGDLIQAHLELEHSYYTTLEGWGRALELRDHETEGHTKRVTEMAVDLALAYGIGLDQIIHIRHGALLHDIGKIGIPDSILLKPAELTPDEWTVMKKHPVYAYNLLKPIHYLSKALAIPYCHHERWDGSGYPRGVKGEEIPLEARIFAVVDVWDALLSDRPYRPRWPVEKVMAYMHEQTGHHFDPRVVEVFLEIL